MDSDWVIQAEEIDPANYFGITVANGMVGLEITDDGIIQLDTALPDSWNSITITGVGMDEVTIQN